MYTASWIAKSSSMSRTVWGSRSRRFELPDMSGSTIPVRKPQPGNLSGRQFQLTLLVKDIDGGA